MVETVGSLRSQPLKGKELRKTNKPLMEKRRRARINTCLNQLKSLVLQAMNKDSSQYSKLEKADILEMTVNFLKAVPHQKARTASQETVNGMAKYNTGFNECASEVARYLGSAHGLDNQVRSRVLSHLSQRVTAINGQPPAPTATTSQPALQPVYVQIPNTTQPIPGVHTFQGYPVNASIPPSATALSSAKSQGALVVMPGAVVVPTPVSMNQEQQWFAHQQQQQQNFVMPLSPASSTSSSRGPSPSISATPSPVHSHPSAQQGVQSSPVPTNVEAQRDQLWRPW